MKVLTAVAALCLASSLTANGQITSPPAQQGQADHRQSISLEKQSLVRELLDALDFKKSMEAIVKTLFDQMDKEIPEAVWQELSQTKEIKELSWTEQQKLYKEIKANDDRGIRIRERLNQKADFAKMTEEITIELYGKYFSESELRDLIVFYKSPAGKRSIEVMPALIGESMTKSTERLMPLMKEVISEVSEEEKAKLENEVAALVKTNHKVTRRAGKRPKARLKNP
jgi:hypothetical protein